MSESTPTRNEAYQTRDVSNVLSLSFKHNFFKNIFFPSAILEWNRLDLSHRNSASYNVFKKKHFKIYKTFPYQKFPMS